VYWFGEGYGTGGSKGKVPAINNPRTAGLAGLTNTGSASTLSGVHPVAMPYPWGGVANTYNGTTTGSNIIPGEFLTPTLGNVRIYMETASNSVVLGYNGAAAAPVAATGLQGTAGIECSSCHDPHNKITQDGYYLVGQGTGSGSTYLCTQCHAK